MKEVEKDAEQAKVGSFVLPDALALLMLENGAVGEPADGWCLRVQL